MAWPLALAVPSLLLIAACAAGPNAEVARVPSAAGFWLGLWHGLICPITFLISLFTPKVNIYEVHNNGNWYDFGFVLGALVALSGAGRSSRAVPRPWDSRRRRSDK